MRKQNMYYDDLIVETSSAVITKVIKKMVFKTIRNRSVPDCDPQTNRASQKNWLLSKIDSHEKKERC
jgi:hypothetical protein